MVKDFFNFRTPWSTTRVALMAVAFIGLFLFLASPSNSQSQELQCKPVEQHIQGALEQGFIVEMSLSSDDLDEMVAAGLLPPNKPEYITEALVWSLPSPTETLLTISFLNEELGCYYGYNPITVQEYNRIATFMDFGLIPEGQEL